MNEWLKEKILDNLHVIFLLSIWTVILSFADMPFLVIVFYIGFGIGLIARYDRMKSYEEYED